MQPAVRQTFTASSGSRCQLGHGLSVLLREETPTPTWAPRSRALQLSFVPQLPPFSELLLSFYFDLSFLNAFLPLFFGLADCFSQAFFWRSPRVQSNAYPHREVNSKRSPPLSQPPRASSRVFACMSFPEAMRPAFSPVFIASPLISR